MDKDLQSIQETRNLLARSKEAQLAFKSFTQEKVDKVVKAIADAGFTASEKLAMMAVEETGFGKVADKKLKNEFSTRRVWESIKDLKTVGVIHDDKEKRIIEIGEPMGVVAALIPSTNPTSTMMFKSLIAVKGRNSIVASPHPKSVNCTLETTRIITHAAESAGAPKDLINCISIPTREGTSELMKHHLTSIILATGSSAMVKAAYSSGKPAYGVGPGNVPSFIERSANVKKAVADIVFGKTFDWGVLCSTESGVILDAPIKKLAVEEFKRRGAYFASPEEKERLSRLMFDPRGVLNAEVVGKSPAFIAQKAGFDIPHDTTCIIAEIPAVGKEYPLSREKLSPVLSMFTVDGWLEGCHRCIELLEFGGIGHSMVIHSSDSEIILKFGLEKPAFRILVNTTSSLGAIGYTNELTPSLTLGPGTWGGSIVSENVSAKHLINIKRLTFETHPINPPEKFGGQPAVEVHTAPTPSKTSHGISSSGHQVNSWIDEIDERIRLKAGNLIEKPNTETKIQKTEENVKPSIAHIESAKPAESKPKYGTGISESDIDRIMKEFQNRT
jgi:acetaldehyde dehydrogenase (acetylating)